MKSSRGGGPVGHKDYMGARSKGQLRRPPVSMRRGLEGDESVLTAERDLEHRDFVHRLARLHVNTDFDVASKH